MISESESRPTQADTLYDCASLTKVTVTLPLILMLLEDGRLRLDDPLCLFIPEFGVNGKSQVTIRHLLVHTSGLMPFTDLHSHSWTRQQIIDSVIGQKLKYEPGTQVVYSDLGYVLLGHLVSLLFGEPLEEAARRRLFTPLGMSDTLFCPPPEWQIRTAATEWYPHEAGPRWGKVHDENAFAMGGVSGHAGLFSTVRDLSRYAQMWLDRGHVNGHPLLSAAAIDTSIRCHTKTMVGAKRGLGWVLKGDPADASGDLLSDYSFGHTGFTGTSVVVDPINQLAIVLLTNRVHLGRQTSVHRLRATFHNAIVSALTD
ncbi:Penicillin-binding protein 4* [compost metagenome]